MSQGKSKELRRYKNRKLYDPDQGYVSLPDVAVMVRAGVDIKVVDHVTGQDRTSHILAQVVAQEELIESRPQAGEKLMELIRLLPLPRIAVDD